MKVRYISIDTNVFHTVHHKRERNKYKNKIHKTMNKQRKKYIIKDYKWIINTIEERFIHK